MFCFMIRSIFSTVCPFSGQRLSIILDQELLWLFSVFLPIQPSISYCLLFCMAFIFMLLQFSSNSVQYCNTFTPCPVQIADVSDCGILVFLPSSQCIINCCYFGYFGQLAQCLVVSMPVSFFFRAWLYNGFDQTFPLFYALKWLTFPSQTTPLSSGQQLQLQSSLVKPKAHTKSRHSGLLFV